MKKQVHVLDTNGKMVYTKLFDDGSDVLVFESGFGHVTRDSITRNFWTVSEGWPLTSSDSHSDDEIEEDMPENDMAPLNLSALVTNSCGHPLTESEFEYYENRRHLDRLCRRCAMEERAR